MRGKLKTWVLHTSHESERAQSQGAAIDADMNVPLFSLVVTLITAMLYLDIIEQEKGCCRSKGQPESGDWYVCKEA